MPILLTDGTTGNLDEVTANEIVSIFQKLAHGQEKCVVAITNSREPAEQTDVVLQTKKGKITDDASIRGNWKNLGYKIMIRSKLAVGNRHRRMRRKLIISALLAHGRSVGPASEPYFKGIAGGCGGIDLPGCGAF